MGKSCGERVVGESGGIKNDGGKLDWSLLPWEALEDVVAVMELGANKYARDNWKYVEPERFVKAGLRHFIQFLNGEEVDEESGKSHLAHLACCALFVLHSERKKEKINE